MAQRQPASLALRYLRARARTGEYILIIRNTLKFIVALPATDVVSAPLGRRRGAARLNTAWIQVGRSFGRFRFGGIITSQRDEATTSRGKRTRERTTPIAERSKLRKSVDSEVYRYTRNLGF